MFGLASKPRSGTDWCGESRHVSAHRGRLHGSFPGVTTTFEVDYAADTNPANNAATRGTVVRAGQCVVGGTPTATISTPTPATSQLPSPTRTPTSLGAPTPTPVAGNPNAPVVTSFTCNGAPQCTVSLGESFTTQFSFTDANGDTTSWRMTGQSPSEAPSEVSSDSFSPIGHDNVVLHFGAFTCPQTPCRQTVFTFSVTVTDKTGLKSAAATVPITMRASGQ